MAQYSVGVLGCVWGRFGWVVVHVHCGIACTRALYTAYHTRVLSAIPSHDRADASRDHAIGIT